MSQLAREVVIVEAVRTPVGRGHKEKGYYKDTPAADLRAASYGELIRRSGVDPAEVELAISGCVQHLGEDTRGGAMALGQPLGSTGGRLLTSLLHAMEDEDKQIGLVTMCCGGGLGTATLMERV